jgi:hypothetical protein
MDNRKKKVIGYLIAEPGNRHEVRYETASWYTLYEIDAGIYPVYEDQAYASDTFVYAGTKHLPATIVDEYTPSGFGGMYYGNSPSAEARKNTRSNISVYWQRSNLGKRNPYRSEFGEWERNGLKFIRVLPVVEKLVQSHNNNRYLRNWFEHQGPRRWKNDRFVNRNLELLPHLPE